jgi:hypothetical protein
MVDESFDAVTIQPRLLNWLIKSVYRALNLRVTGPGVTPFDTGDAMGFRINPVALASSDKIQVCQFAKTGGSDGTLGPPPTAPTYTYTLISYNTGGTLATGVTIDFEPFVGPGVTPATYGVVMQVGSNVPDGPWIVINCNETPTGVQCGS